MNWRSSVTVGLVAACLSAIAYGGFVLRKELRPADQVAPERTGVLREVVAGDSVTTEVNAKAPALASISFDNRNIRSIDYIGDKVVLLGFWSVFCTPCIQEMPFLSSLYEKYRDAGLEVIGVNTDFFPKERLLRFFDRLDPRPSYPIIQDRSQEICRAFNVEALPVTVLIDSSGWIRMYHLGYKPEDRDGLEALVRKWTKRIRESVETVGPVGGKTPVTVSGQTIGEGSPLPDAGTVVIDGRKDTLRRYRGGRPMILFFWSLFCRPCRQEMPLLARLAREQDRKDGPRFLSVNVDSRRLAEQVGRFLKKEDLPFPTLIDSRSDPPGALESQLGIAYTPTLLLVGRDGRVHKVFVGGVDPEHLRAELRRFAAEG